jgi:acyl-CoA thioester hydrolase
MNGKPAHQVELRVPFGDIDWMGHVNNAKYLTYFENARSELLFKTFGGKDGKDWLNLIVARAEIDFKAPARWNDLLLIKIRPESIGKSSWTYEYEIASKEGKIIALGKTVQVAYDYKAKKSIPIPDEMRSSLIRQIEETKAE